MSADLNLSGNIELEIDESQVMAAIDSANRKASDLSGGGGGGGASRRGSSAQMAGISTGESQGIASAVRNALGDVKLPPFPAMPTGLSQAIAGGARGGVPPGLVFAAGRLSTRTFVPPVPPALPSGAAGAARVSGQAAAGIGGKLGLSGIAAAGLVATAGAAAVGLGLKAGADALTKGVDKRIERQLGAGFQFSPELAQLALDRDIRQRSRAITRGQIVGESAQDLQDARDNFLDVTNIGGAAVSNEVNELQVLVLRTITPVLSELIEAVVRLGKGFGAIDKDDFIDIMDGLGQRGNESAARTAAELLAKQTDGAPLVRPMVLPPIGDPRSGF